MVRIEEFVVDGMVVRVELVDGDVVDDTDDGGGGFERVSSRRDVLDAAARSFGAAFDQVRAVGSSALSRIRAMERPPDEVELKFGVKFDAEAGAVIARTGAAAQFEVKLRWGAGRLAAASGPEEEPERPGDDPVAPPEPPV